MDGNIVVIHPDNDFNYNKLDSTDVRTFLQEMLDTLFGVGMTIDIRRGSGLNPTQQIKPSLVDDAMDIF
jgi:hypothetical protein